MSRLPVRLRLTLAFAIAMAVVLAAVGALLYVRLGDSLLEQVDESLQVRADALTAAAREADGPAADELDSREDEGFAQVLATDGSLVASSPSVASRPLVDVGEVQRARSEPVYLRRENVPGLEGEPARLLVEQVDGREGPVVLVVGASLEDRDDALDRLQGQLLLVGPLALILSSCAGYLLAAAALRPVEAMRKRAAEVSAVRTGQRLPLPKARDELRRLGETLNDMLARLETALLHERRFVADASHELRTPLALLQTELELALRRPRSREALEQALRSGAEEVDRLVRLAEDLLVLARGDGDRLPLHASEVPAGDILDSVAGRFARRAADSGRPLTVEVRTNTPVVGDRLRLEQALGNLVDNALRHGDGEVRLEAESHDGLVQLRVSDRGVGFPADFLPRAFERFSRGDAARGRGGSGLGLAIVRAIARAHGGTAEAANLPGGGTSVWLTIPISPGREEDPAR